MPTIHRTPRCRQARPRTCRQPASVPAPPLAGAARSLPGLAPHRSLQRASSRRAWLADGAGGQQAAGSRGSGPAGAGMGQGQSGQAGFPGGQGAPGERKDQVRRRVMVVAGAVVGCLEASRDWGLACRVGKEEEVGASSPSSADRQKAKAPGCRWRLWLQAAEHHAQRQV